jgi:hypothetical protein
MKTPPDGWDDDERQLPEDLARDLAATGPRGAQPPLEVLRAAGEGVLPKEVDASAQWHLAQHDGTRRLVDALNDAAGLDADAEAALFARITRETTAIDRERRSSPWRWQVAAAIGTIAIAGSAWWMMRRDSAVVATPPPVLVAQATAPAVPEFLIPLERPDVRISLSAMTWRGRRPDNPVLVALKPALDAFRAADYTTADREFSIVAQRYPDLIEVALYQGISRLFLSDWSGASISLKRAQAIGDPAFAGDVEWYLAIAEERSGDRTAARQRLQALCDRDRSSPACAIVSATR